MNRLSLAQVYPEPRRARLLSLGFSSALPRNDPEIRRFPAESKELNRKYLQAQAHMHLPRRAFNSPNPKTYTTPPPAAKTTASRCRAQVALHGRGSL